MILTVTEFRNALNVIAYGSGLRKAAAITSVIASDAALRNEIDRLRIEISQLTLPRAAQKP